MKNSYKQLPVFIMALILLVPFSPANAQDNDTLYVPWLDEDDNLLINSLYNAIVSDTLADGTRMNPDRVYKLEQGGFYYNTERLENFGWHLRIVGEPGDPSDEFKNPPMIQLEHRDDGSRTDKILVAGGDVTLKNLIINGKTTLGDLPYEMLRFNAVNGINIIDNVVFEYAQWAILAFYGNNSEIYIRNSRFRNLLSTYQPWGGRGLSVWGDVKKIHIENNTFFNVGGFAIQLEGGVANDFWINHNTFVNIGRHLVLHSWHKNSFFTNNLIVNSWWHGEGAEGFTAIRLEEEDNQYTGSFVIGELPTRYGLDVERVVVVSNNSHYRDQAFEDFYASTSNDDFPLRSQPFVNLRTQNYADAYDNIIIQNTFDGPNPDLVRNADNFQEMIDFIIAIRAEAEEAPLWYWDPGRLDDHYSIQWPLPEDLSYTNTTHMTASIGGFPLGDLNWFPDQKAQWEAQREAIEEDIRGLVGEPPAIVNVGSVEFEDGTLAGDAEVILMEYKLAARVEGSGEPFWTFDMDEAATLDLVVKKRSWWETVNPERQTDVIINDGEAIPLPAGTDLVDGYEHPWAVPKIEGVELVAGTNTIKMGRSWGYLEYESITLMSGADTVMTMYASEADLNGAHLVCSGPICASGDRYVDITNGGVEISKYFEIGGRHIAQIRFIILSGETATADVYLNGTLLGNFTFTGSDENFSIASIGDLDISAGNNTLLFDNVTGNLGLDVIEFFRVDEPVSVRHNEVPYGFSLTQNYPNPFNPTTNIQYSIPTQENVVLKIYNMLGQEVATLVNEVQSPGAYHITFDASHLASGLYIYRIQAGEMTKAKRMMFIK